MLTTFKRLAFWEGLSLLILLFIAMPLKYAFQEPALVRYVGMAHGVLFIAYVLLLAYITIEYKWGFKKCAALLVASIIPFGTFYADKKWLN